MKLIYLVIISVCFSSAFSDEEYLTETEELDKYVTEFKCNHDRTLDLDVSNINVYFLDFKNKIDTYFPIKEAAKNILSLSNLSKLKTFFIFVGGYKSTIDDDIAQRVKKAFKHHPNSYLIIIDHSAYTENKPNETLGYEYSVTYTYYIGRQLAQMLAEMYQGGISLNNIRLIGHSLGSQILGHTGYEFIQMTGDKISRITALDPARPCFTNSSIENQIRSGVAGYVEVYHSNAGGYGTTSVLGDTDFFINNGQSQPYCDQSKYLDSSHLMKKINCDHKTCVIVWLASVGNKEIYPAYKCDNYQNFNQSKCKFNERTIAGFWNPGNATGVFYFSTKGYHFD